MTHINNRRTSGFSMVELLIAVIIIGILVTIIVPVLTNRAADARIAAAKADLEALANAQSQVAIDTGYIVRLHVLDDSGALGDNLASDNINDVVDSIRDEDLHGAPVSNPEFIFLDAKTGVPLLNQDTNLFPRVEADPESVGWRGPYLAFQRKLDPASPPPFAWTFGTPIDPWGNPYFLFVGGPERTGTGQPSGGFIDELNITPGNVSTTFNYGTFSGISAQQFDRNTILSLGPNGVPGDGTTLILGTGDDIVRAF